MALRKKRRTLVDSDHVIWTNNKERERERVGSEREREREREKERNSFHSFVSTRVERICKG